MRPRGLGAHSAHAARMHVSLEEGMQLPARQCCGSVSPHRPCLLLGSWHPCCPADKSLLKSRSCVFLLRSFGLLVCRAFELAWQV